MKGKKGGFQKLIKIFALVLVSPWDEGGEETNRRLGGRGRGTRSFGDASLTEFVRSETREKGQLPDGTTGRRLVGKRIVVVRMRASLGPLAVVGALLLLLHSSIPTAAQFEADAYVGYGTSLYFPFGGTTGAGFRDYFQNGDFPALTLDYWAKSYGGSAVQHMARSCHMTFITKSDTNYLQTFQNEYQTLDAAKTTGSVAEYNTMGVRHFHRLGGPETTLPVSGPLDWSRWTVTITPTTLKLFINGTNIYSTTYDSKALELDLTNQAYFTLGMYTFNPGQTIKTTNFYGQIDELYMWSKEISDADIAANWQNTRLSAADATMKVYHSMDSTAKKSGGPSSTYLENQGTGGASYDLILGGYKDGTTFKDSNTEVDFTGTMPLLVPSTVPYTSVDESFGALNIAVRGYSSAGEAQYTRIRLPYKITVKFKSQGDLNDRETSAALTDNSAVATDDFVYKPPLTATTQDLLSYNKAGDATDYSMAILVTDTLKISDDDTTPNIAVTPVEDELFSMNLRCTSNVGSDCKVKVLEDNENCLYQTKFMSNEAGEFNIDAKAQAGDTLNGPGYTICKLVNDRSGVINNAAKFQLIDDFGETLDVTAKYQVQAMDDVPIGTNKTVNVVEDSAATKIALDILDPETDMYTIAITKLPSKGKLYFEASDGGKGAEITMPFTPWSAKASTYQWAFNVTSVSSFWGNGKNVDYHPIQVLGEQSTTSFGDNVYAWSPLWKDGGTSYAEGGDDIITFAHDPVAYFTANGSYEYIEVSFEESKYITGVEIGECRGMGSIVKVMAWSETGKKYYTLWEGTASNDIQKHHALFQSYRVFGPSICQPPFKSDRVRIELDTKTVPDWNEIDYIKMFGSNELPDGTLNYPSTSVYYEPNKDAYGEDSFEFVGYDCPYDRYRKSDDAAITINIAQVNDEPEVALTEVEPKEGSLLTFASLGFLVNQDDDEINLKIASVSSDIVLFDGAARITAFPYTGKLTDLSLNVTNCRTGEIKFSMKDTGGSAESGIQTVKISPVCHQRPTPCGQTHWNFVVSGCDSNNEREGTYSWKNPRPENPFLPSDCCIEEQNFGVNGSPCVEGANLPKNFTFDCEYIVADSPVSIAMIVINIIVILILVLLMVIYALKAGEKPSEGLSPFSSSRLAAAAFSASSPPSG